MCSTGYMLDTSVFDPITKGQLPRSAFNGRQLFATHVQWDELSRTSDPDLRARLLMTFGEIDLTSLATDTAVWDD
jgi:hypothetical protein